MNTGKIIMQLIPRSIRQHLRESLRIVLREELQAIVREEFEKNCVRSIRQHLRESLRIVLREELEKNCVRSLDRSSLTTDLEGVVDHCDSEVIIGWACDRTQLNTPTQVEVWDGETLVDTLLADSFRQNLYDRGKGSGRHAFTYIIPNSLKDGKTHSISVRFSRKIDLEGSPRVITLEPSSLEHPLIMHTELVDFIGDGAFFQARGREYRNHFVALAGLQPDERVLEIGCGLGRMAIPLTSYLNSSGSYTGMDISQTCINWCTENITPQFPNFRFEHADLFNKAYNPNGKYQASQYRFPHSDESFDFIFLASVFTHMLPDDMENYFSEIARMLKRGGRALITYLLLNPESLQLIKEGKALWKLGFAFEHYRVENVDRPEAIIAYDEQYIRHLYGKYDLEVVEPIHYGAWCGRQAWVSGQDIVLASKH